VNPAVAFPLSVVFFRLSRLASNNLIDTAFFAFGGIYFLVYGMYEWLA
jgi:hypothetical protein